MKQYGFKSTIFLISLVLTATILLKGSIASEDKTFNEYYSDTNKFSVQLLQINEPADLRSDLLVKSKECDGDLCEFLIVEQLDGDATRVLRKFLATQVKPLRTFTNGYRDFSVSDGANVEVVKFQDGSYFTKQDKAFAKMLLDNEKRLDAFRQRLVNDPEEFNRHIAKGLPGQFADLMKQPGTLNRLLNGALATGGCGIDSHVVIGFYNVAHNAWVLFWVRDKGDFEIVHGAMTDGFRYTDGPEKLAWWHLVEEQGTMIHAMRKATEIQMAAFYETFGLEQGCSIPFEEYKPYLNSWDASSYVVAAEKEYSEVDAAFLEKLHADIRSRHKVAQDRETLIVTAGIEDDTVVTLTTFKDAQYFLFLHEWKIEDKDFELVEEGYGFTMEMFE